MNPKIRNESKGDIEQIHIVTVLAFRDAPHTDHTEQFIVKALRRADALLLSQVAELDGKIVGHIVISPVNISDGSANWFGLGPISVLPQYQGKGVGSKLMKNALADLREQGAAGCVVLEDPNYYRRFGFKVVDGLVFPGVPVEYFQALSFGGDFPAGRGCVSRGILGTGLTIGCTAIDFPPLRGFKSAREPGVLFQKMTETRIK